MFGHFGSYALRFRLLGFPVRVDLTFWLLAAMLGLSWGELDLILIWVGVVFASVLAHELGHGLAMRTFGIPAEIELYAMGGLTRPLSWRDMPHWQQIVISLAGSATGLAIGGLTWWFNRQFGPPESFRAAVLVYDILYVNIGWSLLNLLPIAPLDGGHIAESAIHWARGYRDDRLVALIGLLVAGAAALAAISVQMIFAAIMAGLFCYKNVQVVRQHGAVPPRDAAIAAGVALCVIIVAGSAVRWFMTVGFV